MEIDVGVLIKLRKVSSKKDTNADNIAPWNL